MAADEHKITIRPNGPYLLRGGIPLVRKSQVMSEHGEPLIWKKDGAVETDETYRLCRCGQSKSKPFCDNTHTLVAFDGTETADDGPISAREKEFKGEKIVMKDDHSLCVHSGFCGNRVTNIWEMIKNSEDTQVRAQIMAMVENALPAPSLLRWTRTRKWWNRTCQKRWLSLPTAHCGLAAGSRWNEETGNPWRYATV